MKKDNVLNIKNPEAVDLVTQLIREGAHRLIAEAIEAEVESFVEAISERLSDGRPRWLSAGTLIDDGGWNSLCQDYSGKG